MKNQINSKMFWSAVQAGCGMDKREPFINTFIGHSFVTYDDGTIWSSSLKAAFGKGAGLTKIKHHYRYNVDINEVIAELNITNVGDYYTDEAEKNRANIRLEKAQKTVADFEIMATFEYQEAKVRAQISTELNNVLVRKIPGNPIAEHILSHCLNITNYCGKEQVTFTVDLTLKSKNSAKTVGTYIASPVDIEAAVILFANERVADYNENLLRHKQTLLDMQK